MRIRSWTALVVTAAALAVPACSTGTSTSTGTADDPGVLQTSELPDGVELVTAEVPRSAPGDPSLAGAAMTTFGVDLWQRLPADGNLAISPYSIYAVLAMARAGATGATATELDTVLGAQSGSTTTTVDAALRAAVEAPDNPDDSRSLTVETANSLWAQRGLDLLAPFVSTMGSDFGAGVRLTDYAADPEASRAAINSWVAELTRDLVPELCPPGSIDAGTLLTLVNAVYFAANWDPPFVLSTQLLTFTAPTGTLQVPAFGGVVSVPTAEGPGWQSATIPYVGGGAAMTLIVPDAGRFDDVQRALGPDLLAAAQGGTASEVWLTVPTFEVDASISLTEPLQHMAPSMFDDGFTAMASDATLLTSQVIHQAVVSVDEKGTVAAAATAMMLAGGAPTEPRKFTVDRPFLFVIADTQTGAPLFVGRVTNPAE